MAHRRCFVGCAIFLALAAIAGCQTPARFETEDVTSQVFLSNFAVLKRLEFPGRVDEGHTPSNPFEDEPLRMRVLEADSHSARIALHVGDDRSRTWVLTTESDGRLRLRHDHRDPDGTPHDLTDYGGVASPGGTFSRQSFPADSYTAEMLPEAATNVWTLKFDRHNEEFIYDLTRHGRPRFRAVFDLAQPRLIDE